MKQIFHRTALPFLALLLIFACFGAAPGLVPLVYCAILFLVFRAERSRELRADALAALAFIGGFVFVEFLTTVGAVFLAAPLNTYGSVTGSVLEPIVAHVIHLVIFSLLLLLLKNTLQIEGASLLKTLPFAWIVVVVGALLQVLFASLQGQLTPALTVQGVAFSLSALFPGTSVDGLSSNLVRHLVPLCEFYLISVFLRAREPAQSV